MTESKPFEQLKKFAIIITIGILFAVFAFSIADLIVPTPNYSDYCGDYYGFAYGPRPMPEVDCAEISVPEEFRRECNIEGGSIRYELDDSGCAIDYICETCGLEYNKSRERQQLFSFLIVSLIGLIGIFSGIYINSKDEIKGWLLSGFIIGGLISIFAGTMAYFGSMNEVMRPIVIIGEIILVVWLTLRIQSSSKSNSKKKK